MMAAKLKRVHQIKRMPIILNLDFPDKSILKKIEAKKFLPHISS